MSRWGDPTDCFTPEEEAEQDAREAERQEHEWLQSWVDDFHSDEWLRAVAATIPDSRSTNKEARI